MADFLCSSQLAFQDIDKHRAILQRLNLMPLRCSQVDGLRGLVDHFFDAFFANHARSRRTVGGVGIRVFMPWQSLTLVGVVDIQLRPIVGKGVAWCYGVHSSVVPVVAGASGVSFTTTSAGYSSGCIT